MRITPFLILLAACSTEPGSVEPETPDPPDPGARVLAALEDWQDLPLADGPLRISPEDCRLPPPPTLHRSEATLGEHGRKLYALRAGDPLAYRWEAEAPVGQVLIKQTFVPVEVDPSTVPPQPPGATELYPYTFWQGKVWTAGDPGPLFVMTKSAPSTPGTDQGWTYATLTAEGEVIEAGLIADCMDCHDDPETHDRQFGLSQYPRIPDSVLEQVMARPDLDSEWAERVRAVARDYRGWGRFDEAARWSPFRCDAPPPPHARRSASADGETHGRKLYALFVKDVEAYADEDSTSAPVGQVLVKETWVPEPMDPADLPERYPDLYDAAYEAAQVDGWLPFAQDEDGRAWRAGERGPLFVMLKLDPDTPGTDQGWVYATVETDGEVTSVGLNNSCIECHVDAPRDRQFGLPLR